MLYLDEASQKLYEVMPPFAVDEETSLGEVKPLV